MVIWGIPLRHPHPVEVRNVHKSVSMLHHENQNTALLAYHNRSHPYSWSLHDHHNIARVHHNKPSWCQTGYSRQCEFSISKSECVSLWCLSRENLGLTKNVSHVACHKTSYRQSFRNLVAPRRQICQEHKTKLSCTTRACVTVGRYLVGSRI